MGAHRCHPCILFPRYSTGKFIEYTTMIYPDATQAERAFNLDLSCLNPFGGCMRACEIIPSWWPDYSKRASEKDPVFRTTNLPIHTVPLVSRLICRLTYNADRRAPRRQGGPEIPSSKVMCQFGARFGPAVGTSLEEVPTLIGRRGPFLCQSRRLLQFFDDCTFANSS